MTDYEILMGVISIIGLILISNNQKVTISNFDQLNGYFFNQLTSHRLSNGLTGQRVRARCYFIVILYNNNQKLCYKYW